MKTQFIFLIMVFSCQLLSTLCQDISAEENSLMDKIIKWRQIKNLNLGTKNQLQRTLDYLSSKECDSLLADIDKLGKFDNFPVTVVSEALGDGEYIAEFVVKAQKSSDYPSAIYQLWTDDYKVTENLSYEYNEYGLSCKIYGIARVCVMHLKYSIKNNNNKNYYSK